MNCTWCKGRGVVTHVPRQPVPTAIDTIDPTAAVTVELVDCPVCQGSGREPVRCHT